MRTLWFALSLTLLAAASPSARAAGPCHRACRDLTIACKESCKATRAPISAGRYDCLHECKAQEHRCRAGCY